MALGVDNSWSQDEFEARFSVEGMQWAVLPRPQDGRQDRGAIQFDLLNVDPAIANAFRRILISELPTMAIEHVFIVDNTSVMTVRRTAASLSWQAGVLPCRRRLGLANVVVSPGPGPSTLEDGCCPCPQPTSLFVLGCSAKCWRTAWALFRCSSTPSSSKTRLVRSPPLCLRRASTAELAGVREAGQVCAATHRPSFTPYGRADALDARAEGKAASEKSTVVFKLAVACKRRPDGSMLNDRGARCLAACYRCARYR